MCRIADRPNGMPLTRTGVFLVFIGALQAARRLEAYVMLLRGFRSRCSISRDSIHDYLRTEKKVFERGRR